MRRAACRAAEGQRQEDRIRAERDAAIERSLKGDAVIRVVDGQGRPVSGAKVVIEQLGNDCYQGKIEFWEQKPNCSRAIKRSRCFLRNSFNAW